MARVCISVDLPEPEGPIIAVNLPPLKINSDIIQGVYSCLTPTVGFEQVFGGYRWKFSGGGFL